MRNHLIYVALALATNSTAQVFKFPLGNGFPNVSNATITALTKQAGGPLPSAGSPLSLPDTAFPALQAVAFNEIFEVAFFSQLLQNITTNQTGYELGDDRDMIIAAVSSSQAQEELHFLQANEGLKASGKYAPIKPCEYRFPVSTFKEAMVVADMFTGLLMGGIQALITDFGDLPEIVTLFDAVLGQEGQQDGYFRWLRQQIPNQAPFLTATQLSFIYNHIVQHYTVPGSCPQNLGLPNWKTLLSLDAVSAKNSTIRFTTSEPHVTSADYIVYMSGQLSPRVEAISNIVPKGSATEFSALFPYDVGFSRGLTVAALVNNPGPFSDVSEVANATVAGPALLTVYYE